MGKPEAPRLRYHTKGPPAAGGKSAPLCRDPRFIKQAAKDKTKKKVAKVDKNKRMSKTKAKEVERNAREDRKKDNRSTSTGSNKAAKAHGQMTTTPFTRPSALRKTSHERSKEEKKAKKVNLEELEQKLRGLRKAEAEDASDSGSESEESLDQHLTAALKKEPHEESPQDSGSEGEEDDEDDGDEEDGGDDQEEGDQEEEDDETFEANESSESEEEEEEEEQEEDENERKKKEKSKKAKERAAGHEQPELADVAKATAPAVRNSVTHKVEWDAFCRQCQNRKVFPAELSGYLTKGKTDLFGAWLDSGRVWSKVCLIMKRTHSSSNEALAGWIAVQGKALVNEYGKEKADGQAAGGGSLLQSRRFRRRPT